MTPDGAPFKADCSTGSARSFRGPDSGTRLDGHFAPLRGHWAYVGRDVRIVSKRIQAGRRVTRSRAHPVPPAPSN